MPDARINAFQGCAMANIKKDFDKEEAGSISICLSQFKGGDSTAAQNLWERYYPRLIGLARKKLGATSRRAMDEDDVVQNAFDSFCRRARAGAFPNLNDRDSLWALLAMITARKAGNQRLHEHRAKRGGHRLTNQSSSDGNAADGEPFEVVSAEPSPAEATLFVTQLERFMNSLPDASDRLILLWKLEERTNPEIAKYLDCSLSTVEAKLRNIRKRLRGEIQID
jgi:RNA polymerase sigma factor (sigma-70 family)